MTQPELERTLNQLTTLYFDVARRATRNAQRRAVEKQMDKTWNWYQQKLQEIQEARNEQQA